MATEFCQRCKQTHPGRPCDYDEKGECEETIDAQENGAKSVDRTPMRRESSDVRKGEHANE